MRTDKPLPYLFAGDEQLLLEVAEGRRLRDEGVGLLEEGKDANPHERNLEKRAVSEFFLAHCTPFPRRIFATSAATALQKLPTAHRWLRALRSCVNMRRSEFTTRRQILRSPSVTRGRELLGAGVLPPAPSGIRINSARLVRLVR